MLKYEIECNLIKSNNNWEIHEPVDGKGHTYVNLQNAKDELKRAQAKHPKLKFRLIKIIIRREVIA